MFSVIFGTPYQSPCHLCLKVANECSFCVFLGNRQCKNISSGWRMERGTKKTRKIQIVVTEKDKGRLTRYKCQENRELQNCWKWHTFWKGNSMKIWTVVSAGVRANFSRSVMPWSLLRMLPLVRNIRRFCVVLLGSILNSLNQHKEKKRVFPISPVD